MGIQADIGKRFKGFSLSVQFETEGRPLGILGASGCGKSMTLKCIAGVQTPDRGRVSVNGRALFDSKNNINLPPRKRRVGYLFQNYALFPHMTVEQNIACGFPKGGAVQREKIRQVTDMFRLAGLGHRYPSQLSGGQQQRVALARILAYDPDVLLLDEPFAALDAYLREELQLQLLKLFSHFDKDVVLVTHNRDEVYKLCGRLMVLHNGRMLKIGDTRRMFKQPEFLQVARLTGCKNFSAAKKTGAHTLYAADWDISLLSDQPVGDGVTHVGVRAHDFKPASQAEGVNVLAVEMLSCAADPFESNVIFRRKGVKSEIWWKVPGPWGGEAPAYLTVSPADVLPLEDKVWNAEKA